MPAIPVVLRNSLREKLYQSMIDHLDTQGPPYDTSRMLLISPTAAAGRFN
jgi:hypothetical protein